MNTKTLTILILTFLLITVLAFIIGITTITNNKTVEASTINTSNHPKIITENGFKVLADNDPDRQTIFATVVSKTSDGKYNTAINNYDANDTILIDGQFSKGDKVMITFFHDDVESVKIIERNEL